MHNNWDECDCFARHLGDDGQERVVMCSLGRHSVPGNHHSEWHFDPDLEIYWRYADEDYDDNYGS